MRMTENQPGVVVGPVEAGNQDDQQKRGDLDDDQEDSGEDEDDEDEDEEDDADQLL